MNKAAFKEGFLHLFKATGYSLAGLSTGIRLSLAFRQECGVFILLVIFLLLLGKSPSAWLLVLGAWLLVMMAELINTALEETLNLITKEYNIAVKNAKDMASAAVFLLLVLNGSIWLCVFIIGIL